MLNTVGYAHAVPAMYFSSLSGRRNGFKSSGRNGYSVGLHSQVHKQRMENDLS